jgi:aromatic-amino-acid transaminase
MRQSRRSRSQPVSQPMNTQLFNGVELAPRDPILGLTESFAADSRPNKVNLGVGVYYDDEGKIPVLQAIREAERARIEKSAPRGYLPIDGIAAYDAAVQKLLLGESSPLIAEGRVVTAQSLGGTGGLKIGADFLKRIKPDAKVLISDPSWENHRALFEGAGFQVGTYPYYDSGSHGVDFAAMQRALEAAGPDTIVVLHACCHNPTGVDLSAEQWHTVVRIARERRFIPFLDIAYQGLGEGLDADSFAVRLFAESGVPFFVSSSFSKSFSLYGERVGALTIIATSKDEATRVLSQLKRVIRANYSTPPTHGGSVIAAVLTDARLRALWERELGEMRERIRQMRARFVEGLKARGVKQDMSFVLRQRGMFSYSGLSAAQVERLKNEFGIYAVSTGRICVAALNSKNIAYVLDAIAAVMRG